MHAYRLRWPCADYIAYLSGKSFTMIGAADIGSCLRDDGDFDESAGIAPRAVVELFRLLKERDNQITYQVNKS